MGLYIVIVAGTRVLPQWLRFKDWKRWMRAELMLWSIVVLTGVGTYYAWYIAPFRAGWGDLSHIKPMVRRPNSDVKSADISLFGNISQVAEF